MAKMLSKETVAELCKMAEMHMTYFRACKNEGASEQQALVLTGYYMRAVCEAAVKGMEGGKKDGDKTSVPKQEKP